MNEYIYKSGEPCNHSGCLSHITHPCEGCGRIGGEYPPGEIPWVSYLLSALQSARDEIKRAWESNKGYQQTAKEIGYKLDDERRAHGVTKRFLESYKARNARLVEFAKEGLEEAEQVIGSEVLAGNIVKESFVRGEAAAYRAMLVALTPPAEQEKPETCQQCCGSGIIIDATTEEGADDCPTCNGTGKPIREE